MTDKNKKIQQNRITLREASHYFKLKIDTLRKHVAKYGLKPDDKHRYNLNELKDAIADARTNDNKNIGLEAKSVRELVMALKAELLRIELGEKQKKLLPADQVQKQWNAIAQLVKTKLEALPNSVAPLCENKKAIEIAEILRKAINDVLLNLSYEADK